MALEHFRKPDDKTYDEWDMFCLKPMKNRVVDILRKINPPLTMALYGQWGTGKTEIINAVIDDLENISKEKGSEEEYLTLYFDAWEYRKEDNIAIALLAKMYNKFKDIGDDIGGDVVNVLKTLSYVGSNVVMKVVTAGMADIGDVKDGLALSEDECKEYIKYVDSVEDLKNEYISLIDRILEKKEKDKIFIFVDNLDRCLPDVVVNLLENISIFLSYKDVKCIYTLAMDKDHVVKAINHLYPDFEGDKYLEKIIHFDINMPMLKTGIKAFADIYENIFEYRQFEGELPKGKMVSIGVDLSSHLGDQFLEFTSVPHDRAKDEMVKVLMQIENIFGEDFLGNPRRMHKVIRQLYLLEENTKKTKHSLLMLLFLCSFKEFYPMVYFSLSPEKDIDNLLLLIQQSITFNPEAFNKMQYNSAREAKDYLFGIKNSILVTEFIRNALFRKFLTIFLEWKANGMSNVAVFKQELIKSKSMIDVFV